MYEVFHLLESGCRWHLLPSYSVQVIHAALVLGRANHWIWLAFGGGGA